MVLLALFIKAMNSVLISPTSVSSWAYFYTNNGLAPRLQRAPYRQIPAASATLGQQQTADSLLLNCKMLDTPRPVSSLYSSSVASSSSSSDTTETQRHRDSYYRGLISERLEQLLDRLAFLKVRHGVLEREMHDAEQRRTEVAWEVFRIDPVRGSFTHCSDEVAGDSDAIPPWKMDVGERWQLEQVQHKQAAKAELQRHLDELRERLARNQKKIDDGLRLMWRILKERVRVNPEVDETKEKGVDPATTTTGPRAPLAPDGIDISLVEQILKLLEKCSFSELKDIQSKVDGLRVPALRPSTTDYRPARPVALRPRDFSTWI